MHISVYVALVAALILSVVVAPMAQRLAPKAESYVLAAAAVIAGAMWAAALCFLAVATIGRFRLVRAFGHWSAAILDAHAPVPLLAGLGGVALLAVVFVSLSRAAIRLGRGLVQLRRVRLMTHDGVCGDVTVIDIPRPEALAVPGLPGRVVVTSGMLQALEPAERAVLIAHERCHLGCGHWAFRVATRLGAALLPTVRPLVSRCDLTLERWADEVAASEVGDRELAARSVAKAALVTTDYQRSALSLAFADGAVRDRVEALLAPQRPSRWSPMVWPILIAGIGAATLIEACRELEKLFDLAGHF